MRQSGTTLSSADISLFLVPFEVGVLHICVAMCGCCYNLQTARQRSYGTTF